MAYTVVGFLEEDFGLGVAARNSLRALVERGRAIARVPIQHHGYVAARPPRSALPGSGAPVTIFHLNPDQIEEYAVQWRPHVDPAAATVCVPFWELPLVPRHWEPMLRALGAVLAPTRFVQEACARVLPADHVLLHPQAVFHPEARPARDAWGLSRGATVFMLSFDIGSDIERKNPWAVIDAFRRAFPSERNVALVIKTKPYPQVPAYQTQARALGERVQGDARIRVIERALDYDELLALYASCDVMVSLHRAEGLGLHLMEAMSLGKPVVATGWSGNVDYMTPENSVAIGCRLVPFHSEHLGYQSERGREGQVWADADVVEAARAMRALHQGPDRRAALGAAAARDMEARRREMLDGRAFDALERDLQTRSPEPRTFSLALRQLARHARWATFRRRARRVARMLLGPRPR